MRIIVACCLVVLSIVAALGFAQTQSVFGYKLAKEEPAAAAPKAPAPTKTAPTQVVTTMPEPTAAPVAAATAPVAVAANTQPAPAAAAPAAAVAQAPAAAPAPAPPAPAPVNCPGNPNALGVSRVVEIDTTGGPGFGFEHFKQYDFLKPGEVVLTFDDGPWLNNTPRVLAALAAHCTKAIFFPIGKHSTYYPEILQQVAAAGHTIGSHTWSHADLSKKSLEDGKTEFEMGVAAVRAAIGDNISPFFRFPALRHPPELVTYLGERNVAIWSTDMDSFDFKMHKPEQVVKSVMEKLKKHGKGIVLMHDFQHATAEAAPELLNQLKAGGYKIVQVKAKGTLQSLPQYDEMVRKENKLPTVTTRPVTDVVKTVN